MYTEGKIVLIKSMAKTKEEVIKRLAAELYEKGYVTADFADCVLNREKMYPTGLEFESLGVAIPHTDADKVKTPQIAFAVMETPVIFQSMADIEKEVEASLVFLLAIKKSDEQVLMLQKLVEILQNKEFLHQLQTAPEKEEFIELIHQAGIR